MDQSSRSLSIITLLVIAGFLTLNHIIQRSPLADWGLVLLLLLLALALWAYGRYSRRATAAAEYSTVDIEPIAFERPALTAAAPPAPAEPVVAQPPPPPAPPAAVIEAPPPVAPAPVEPAVAPPPTVKAAAPAQPDDLKIVEGIGPKMEKALHAAGITTFAALAAATEEQIRAAIQAAGMRFAPSVPTWPSQAAFAAKGDLDGLKAYQQTLTAGRKS